MSEYKHIQEDVHYNEMKRILGYSHFYKSECSWHLQQSSETLEYLESLYKEVSENAIEIEAQNIQVETIHRNNRQIQAQLSQRADSIETHISSIKSLCDRIERIYFIYN